MSSLVQDLELIASRGIAWWTSELASLIPGASNGARRSATGAVVALEQGQLRLVPKPGARAEPVVGDAVLDLLSRQSRTGRPVPVTVRLPYTACLARRVEIPDRARADADRILALELERATPLEASAIYSAHTRDGAASARGATAYRQLIVKKSTLDPVIAKLEAAGANVVSADCWDEDGQTALPLNFIDSAADKPRQKGSNGVSKLLAVLAVGLALSAIWISFSRHQAVLTSLEQQTTEARQRLAMIDARRTSTNTVVNERLAVQNLKAMRAPAVHSLDELTKLLPDDAYLNDLSFDGDTISIGGYAKNAASLLPLLEKSEMFAAPELAAPVTFDTSRNKERFSYRMKLKTAGTPAAPAEAAP